jgi:DNA (cytosine-5)-methyltransferase 1
MVSLRDERRRSSWRRRSSIDSNAEVGLKLVDFNGAEGHANAIQSLICSLAQGGLSEGFSSLRHAGQPVFKIGFSIEKDEYAHRTLELRSFFRQFPDHKAPDAYYDYLAGRISREELFSLFRDDETAPEAAAAGGKDPNEVVDPVTWCVIETGSDWGAALSSL